MCVCALFLSPAQPSQLHRHSQLPTELANNLIPNNNFMRTRKNQHHQIKWNRNTSLWHIRFWCAVSAHIHWLFVANMLKCWLIIRIGEPKSQRCHYDAIWKAKVHTPANVSELTIQKTTYKIKSINFWSNFIIVLRLFCCCCCCLFSLFHVLCVYIYTHLNDIWCEMHSHIPDWELTVLLLIVWTFAAFFCLMKC